MKKINLTLLSVFLCFTLISQNWFPSDTNWYIASLNCEDPKNILDNNIDTWASIQPGNTGTVFFEFDDNNQISSLIYVQTILRNGARCIL